MAILDWSKSIGVAAAITFLLVMGILGGPATCADGWRSPSIGARGACSYHRGVARTGPLWFLISIAVGFAAWGLADANSPRRRRELDEQRQRKLAEATTIEARRREFEERQILERPRNLGAEAAVEPTSAPIGKRCFKCNEAMSALISSTGPHANRLHWQCQNSTCDGVIMIEEDLFPAHSRPGRIKPRTRRPSGRRRRR
jgi:hypothetical protein